MIEINRKWWEQEDNFNETDITNSSNYTKKEIIEENRKIYEKGFLKEINKNYISFNSQEGDIRYKKELPMYPCESFLKQFDDNEKIKNKKCIEIRRFYLYLFCETYKSIIKLIDKIKEDCYITVYLKNHLIYCSYRKKIPLTVYLFENGNFIDYTNRPEIIDTEIDFFTEQKELNDFYVLEIISKKFGSYDNIENYTIPSFIKDNTEKDENDIDEIIYKKLLNKNVI